MFFTQLYPQLCTVFYTYIVNKNIQVHEKKRNENKNLYSLKKHPYMQLPSNLSERTV